MKGSNLMYQGCNKTALSSQKSIADSFYALLLEKDYSKINICEICKRAQISRQTFYTLFSSKENIIHFILSNKYSFDPTKECHCKGQPTHEELSLGFASFIESKADFIKLLEKNKIIYLLQESIYKDLKCCQSKNKDGDLTVDFIAAGLTTIAKHYLMDDASWSNKELSDTILRLFSGDFFR